MKTKGLSGLVTCMILLVVWQLAVSLGGYSPLVLPGPVKVGKKLLQAVLHENLLKQVALSMTIICKGMGIAGLGAAMLLLLTEKSRAIGEGINALCTLVHPIPGVAILPIFMIWFGIGEHSAVAVIVHAVLWTFYINVSAGIKSMPKIYGQLASGYSIKGIQKWVHIILPATVPYVLSALRTGWARAWRALISVEMIFGATGSGGGLGWYIFKNRVFMDTSGMFAGLIAVVLVGLAVEKYIFDLFENKTLKKWGMI